MMCTTFFITWIQNTLHFTSRKSTSLNICQARFSHNLVILVQKPTYFDFLKESGPYVETSCVFFCIKNIINAEMWAWKNDSN